MRITGAGHGDGAGEVFQAVIGLVLDGGVGGQVLHLRIQAATLDHEVINDPVKNGAVVMAAGYVAREIFHGRRGLVRIQLQ